MQVWKLALTQASVKSSCVSTNCAFCGAALKVPRQNGEDCQNAVSNSVMPCLECIRSG